MATANLSVGCTGFGGHPPRRYFERLTAVELQQTFFNPPRRASLRRLRDQAPAGFAFVVKVWQLVTHEPGTPGYQQLPKSFKGPLAGAGHFRDVEAVALGWSRSCEAAVALDAKALLFESPTSFTPTAEHRRALTRFFERCARPEGRLLVWCPAGVWSAEEVTRICRDLQLVPTWDPFADAAGNAPAAPPDLAAAYIRPRGLGASRRHTDTQLLWLRDQLRRRPGSACCLFCSPLLFGEAERLLALHDSDVV
jgi:uncharacterized protein YecE (DUF72 family)